MNPNDARAAAQSVSRSGGSGVQRVRVTYEGPGEQSPSKAGWWLNNWFAHKENIVSVVVLSGVEADEGDALRAELISAVCRANSGEHRSEVDALVADAVLKAFTVGRVAAPVPSPLLFKDGDVVAYTLANADGTRRFVFRNDGKWTSEVGWKAGDDAWHASAITRKVAYLVDTSRPVGEAE